MVMSQKATGASGAWRRGKFRQANGVRTGGLWNGGA